MQHEVEYGHGNVDVKSLLIFQLLKSKVNKNVQMRNNTAVISPISSGSLPTYILHNIIKHIYKRHKRSEFARADFGASQAHEVNWSIK